MYSKDVIWNLLFMVFFIYIFENRMALVVLGIFVMVYYVVYNFLFCYIFLEKNFLIGLLVIYILFFV